MLAATVFLAIAANFYELLCTAGFPMVYTRLLTLSELPPAGRYFYLALYNLIYVVPLALIVLAFVRTLGARKLTRTRRPAAQAAVRRDDAGAGRAAAGRAGMAE